MSQVWLKDHTWANQGQWFNHHLKVQSNSGLLFISAHCISLSTPALMFLVQTDISCNLLHFKMLTNCLKNFSGKPLQSYTSTSSVHCGALHIYCINIWTKEVKYIRIYKSLLLNLVIYSIFLRSLVCLTFTPNIIIFSSPWQKHGFWQVFEVEVTLLYHLCGIKFLPCLEWFRHIQGKELTGSPSCEPRALSPCIAPMLSALSSTHQFSHFWAERVSCFGCEKSIAITEGSETERVREAGRQTAIPVSLTLPDGCHLP